MDSTNEPTTAMILHQQNHFIQEAYKDNKAGLKEAIEERRQITTQLSKVTEEKAELKEKLALLHRDNGCLKSEVTNLKNLLSKLQAHLTKCAAAGVPQSTPLHPPSPSFNLKDYPEGTQILLHILSKMQSGYQKEHLVHFRSSVTSVLNNVLLANNEVFWL